MKRRINKVLIANRGEIALRIIRTLREKGVKSVAVYSDADADSPHVRMADEAYHLPGRKPSETYLNVELLIDIARKSGVDAVHPGYGFLAENADFAGLVEDNGFIFIGPSPDAMRLSGDKSRAREVAIKSGIPVVPGSSGTLKTPEEALKVAREVGFPVMIKARAGGGGKGMRIVRREEELLSSFRTASSEAAQAFGDGSLYVEKAILNPRHVEVQILGDLHGNVIHLFERDCSVQRRHQKLVEETPAPGLSNEARERLWNYAVKMAKATGYTNAGTVEFLVDENENCYFIEVNARLQVEHPVTEEVTGLDLVALQIDVEEGVRISEEMRPEKPLGCAMELRINAEDPFNAFVPSPGKITHLNLPSGRGIRVDGGVEVGNAVPVEYDPLIIKLILKGRERGEVIERAKRALEEFEISGIETTVPFHLWLLDNEDFLSGMVHTGLAENFIPPSGVLDEEEVVAVAAAYFEWMGRHSTLLEVREKEKWRLAGRRHTLSHRRFK